MQYGYGNVIHQKGIVWIGAGGALQGLEWRTYYNPIVLGFILFPLKLINSINSPLNR